MGPFLQSPNDPFSVPAPAPGSTDAAAADADKAKPKRSAHLGDLEQQIASQLSTKVHIKPARKKGAGTLLIEFYDLDQFDTLLGRLGVELS